MSNIIMGLFYNSAFTVMRLLCNVKWKFWILSDSTLHAFTIDNIKLYREFNRADDRFC